MTKHEPLDQTNPENRCTVDGVEYVACKRKAHCLGCAADFDEVLCDSLGKCLASTYGKRKVDAIWRPASEFTPTVATLPTWRPIEEIVNKEDGRSVLLLSSGRPFVGYWEDPYWADRESAVLSCVTHFIEIPKKP